MKESFIHSALFRILVPPVIGLFAYLVILLIFNDLTLLVSFFATQELYVVIFITYVLFEWERFSVVLINRFYPFEKGGTLSIITKGSVSLLTAVLIVQLVLSLYYDLFLGFSISPNLLKIFIGIFLIVSLMYQLFYYGLYFLSKKHESRYKEELERNEAMRESMIRFKNELNPQMLYNSLESLILLSRKDKDEADDFINDLSGLYRYILSNKQSELIGLATELQMSNRLLRLINYRLLDSIELQSNLEDQKKSLLLIPGTLPKVIEQIAESSIVSPTAPLTINCDYEEDSEYIVISYPLNDRLVLSDNSTINDMQRSYSFYSDKPVVHVKAYGTGYIKIPALFIQNQE